MPKKRKKDFEIKFYEGLLEKKPNFVQALISLGDAYTRRGFYQEGLEVDKKLVKLKPEDPVVRYNLACSLSLTGEIDHALRELKKAIVFGYDDIPYILQDPDLDNLRKHSQFHDFFDKVHKVKKT
ncbi:MAG: hypothetical protein WCI77_04205 [Candidatus Omnitrophota bacterium]